MADGVRLDIVVSDEENESQPSRVTSTAGESSPAAGSPTGAAPGQGEAGGSEEAAEGGSAASSIASISNKLATAFEFTRQKVELLGKTTADLARNDYMAAFNTVVDESAAALSKIPVVGEALGNGLQLLVAPVRAAAEVMGAFVQRGEQLAGYSAEIASARAVADARTVQADIHEAQELGPGIASMTLDMNRAWIEIREILLPIKRIIVDILAGVMENVADGLAYLRDRIRDGVALLEQFFEFQRQYNPAMWIGGIGDKIVSRLESIRKSLDRNEDTPDTLAMLNRILEGLEAVEGVPIAPAVPGGGPLDVPIFGGP